MRHLRSLSQDDIRTILASGLRIDKHAFGKLKKEDLVLLFSKELRAAAGSSTKNLFRRDHDFPYKQILIDVADKLSHGKTPISWTTYKLADCTNEEEIENTIATLFEERVRKWWSNLSEKKKAEFVGGINAVFKSDEVHKAATTGGAGSFVTQQFVENIIQMGIIHYLSTISAGGALGMLGASVVGQLGWFILLHTVGWMGGVKIAMFGIGGYGAFGGAVSAIGSTAIGSALAIPGVFVLVDGPAYRKTIPTIVMLIARRRATMALRDY